MFEASHQLIFELVEHDIVQGLRIDHIDGLTDPKGYLDRLQRRLAELRPDAGPFYLVVEKILIGDERLPDDWPVAGTTGYEFMNEALRLLVDRPGLHRLDELATAFTGEDLPFPEIAQAPRRRCWNGYSPASSRHLAAGRPSCVGSSSSWRARRCDGFCWPFRSIVPTAAPAGGPRTPGCWSRLSRPRSVTPCRRWPTLCNGSSTRCAMPQGKDGTAFVQGLQQLSGPLMAKSVEDTAFYRHVACWR